MVWRFSRRSLLLGGVALVGLPAPALAQALASPPKGNLATFVLREEVVNRLGFLPDDTEAVVYDPLSRIRLIGDMHAGLTSLQRFRAVADDLWTLPAPHAVLSVGDEAHFGTPPEYAWIRRWVYQWSVPFYSVTGNHTFWGVTELHRDTNVRAYRRWCDTWELTLPYAFELGGVRFVATGPVNGTTGPVDASVTEGELAQLAGLLGEKAQQPTVLVVHAPLYDTVLGDRGPISSVFTSIQPGFYQWHTRGIRKLLAVSPQVKLVVTGHTHSPLDARGLLCLVRAGDRVVPHFNAMALPFVRRPWWGLHRLPQDLMTWELAITSDYLVLTGRDHHRRQNVAMAAIPLRDDGEVFPPVRAI